MAFDTKNEQVLRAIVTFVPALVVSVKPATIAAKVKVAIFAGPTSFFPSVAGNFLPIVGINRMFGFVAIIIPISGMFGFVARLSLRSYGLEKVGKNGKAEENQQQTDHFKLLVFLL